MDVGLEGRRTQSDEVDTRSRMRGQHTQNDLSGLQGSRELGTENGDGCHIDGCTAPAPGRSVPSEGTVEP
jgi:hypothetical protein